MSKGVICRFKFLSFLVGMVHHPFLVGMVRHGRTGSLIIIMTKSSVIRAAALTEYYVTLVTVAPWLQRPGRRRTRRRRP